MINDCVIFISKDEWNLICKASTSNTNEWISNSCNQLIKNNQVSKPFESSHNKLKVIKIKLINIKERRHFKLRKRKT